MTTETESIPQLRERIKTLEKVEKDLTGQNAQLRSELRVRDAREVFRDAGYNPKHGDLWAAQNSDADGPPSVEQVAQFAEAWDLSPAANETETNAETEGEGGGSTEQQVPGSADLARMTRSGTGAGEGGSGGSDLPTMSRSEWRALRAKDPSAAQAAVRQGRVEGTTHRTSGGQSNPYDRRQTQE